MVTWNPLMKRIVALKKKKNHKNPNLRAGGEAVESAFLISLGRI